MGNELADAARSSVTREAATKSVANERAKAIPLAEAALKISVQLNSILNLPSALYA